MKSTTQYQRTTFLFILFIIFYAIQFVFSFFIEWFAPSLDLAAITIGLIFVLALHHRLHLNPVVPWCLGIGFLFHILGLYQIIPYNEFYVGTLYGAPQLFHQYDLLVHSVGFGFLVFALCSFLYPYVKDTIRNKGALFILFLITALGFGAVNEIIEYTGFTIFGYGEGFFEFGTGDSTPESGPWNDAMQDLIANLFGASLSILLYMLLHFKEMNFKKQNS